MKIWPRKTCVHNFIQIYGSNSYKIIIGKILMLHKLVKAIMSVAILACLDLVIVR